MRRRGATQRARTSTSPLLDVHVEARAAIALDAQVAGGDVERQRTRESRRVDVARAGVQRRRGPRRPRATTSPEEASTRDPRVARHADRERGAAVARRRCAPTASSRLSARGARRRGADSVSGRHAPRHMPRWTSVSTRMSCAPRRRSRRRPSRSSIPARRRRRTCAVVRSVLRESRTRRARARPRRRRRGPTATDSTTKARGRPAAAWGRRLGVVDMAGTIGAGRAARAMPLPTGDGWG